MAPSKVLSASRDPRSHQTIFQITIGSPELEATLREYAIAIGGIGQSLIELVNVFRRVVPPPAANADMEGIGHSNNGNPRRLQAARPARRTRCGYREMRIQYRRWRKEGCLSGR